MQRHRGRHQQRRLRLLQVSGQLGGNHGAVPALPQEPRLPGEAARQRCLQTDTRQVQTSIGKVTAS